MKTKSISKLFFMVAVLIVLVSFAGCNLVDNGLQLNDSSASRKVGSESGNKPTEFFAIVYVTQIPESVVTLPVGQGGRYRTTEEILTGSVTSSDWDALLGAGVSMSNFTNFELDSPLADGSFPLTGTNHSDIEIEMLSGEKLMLTANGQLEGVFPAFADVTMNFSSTGPNGKASKTNLHGTLTGVFVWYLYYLDPPQGYPYGYFTLKGSYN